jgi:hypothetical protein
MTEFHGRVSWCRASKIPAQQYLKAIDNGSNTNAEGIQAHILPLETTLINGAFSEFETQPEAY